MWRMWVPYLQQCSKESMKDKKENFGEFFTDKVLEVLAKDMGEFGWRKVAPIFSTEKGTGL